MSPIEQPTPDIREKILQAAAKEFAEKGYTGSRVDAIARRAGVNKALLYYHLGDKATLYGEVILSNLRGAEAAMHRALQQNQKPEEKFRTVVHTVAHMIAEAPYLPRLILREAAFGGLNLPDPVLKEIGRIFILIRSVLEEGQAHGDFRSTNPLMTHFLIAGSILFLSVSTPLRQRLSKLENLDVPLAESPDEIAAHITDILLNGLLT
jgi:TetR/AcrR family transcriptional regulator